MRTYRAQKAGLTRAINSGDPTKVVAECARFVAEYDTRGLPWPDDWHRWNIAVQDATNCRYNLDGIAAECARVRADITRDLEEV